ncbi:MAG: OmpA family protein [Candidatus Delongbacteria bacterium]|nr:OmpA family protein [Candidatus Delongbacteria bacterium]
MKKMMTMLLALLLASIAGAEELAHKPYFGLKGGLARYHGDINNAEYNYGGGLYGGYWITNDIGVELTAGMFSLKANSELAGFETSVIAIAPMVKYRFLPDKAYNPYLTLGVEWLMFDPMYYDTSDKLPRNDAGDYETSAFAIPLGAGFSNFFHNNLNFQVEALYHYCLTDDLDDIEDEGDDSYFTFTAGIAWYFGLGGDTDGDGFPDNRDADPLHAEDFDGYQDDDGAPDPDNDNDGVPDVTDGDPNTPEDLDGFQDRDGVPDPDNDGDGILDSNDADPNAPEDFDGFEDSDGAPDPDNDGDGILDVNDGCPDLAENFNGYEDNDGCPDTKPEVAVERGAAIVLEGVNFAFGSAVLTAGSLEILDKVVRTMQDNPHIELEIRGYTDNRGGQAANERFSQMRAETVRNYLLQNGIAESRVGAVGFGPADPVATNETDEGRARNRRIEFFRVK